MLPNRLIRNVFTVGGFTAFSRVLGLVREMLQSRLIGAGVEQSAFTLAFAIPNMARKLFGEGALTAAFVPVFRGEVERGELESARRLARAVMTMVMMILGSVVILTILALTILLHLSPTSFEFSSRTVLTLRLVRILFPYMIFICGAAFGMGVLNALGKFVEGAFMPAMLNFIWIGTLGLLCFFPGLPVSTRVTIVCWAILLGGLAQMLFLFRCMAKRGYAPRLVFKGLLEGKAGLVWKNTFIAAVGAGAVQINYMLDQVLAQCASPWAAGVIGYAERLMDLPLGIVGVAFGTVLLPTFAGLFAKNDLNGAREALGASVKNLSFVMIPAAAGLFVLAPEITGVIYEGHAFDALATCRVSRALSVYALGLAFFGWQKSLIPWFQAQGDMKTPLQVSVRMVFLNAALNVLAVVSLSEEWRHVGLAASTDACAAIGCVMLGVLARRKNGDLGLKSVVPFLFGVLVASLMMAGGLLFLKSCLSQMNRIAALTIEVASGAAIYGLFALLPRRLYAIIHS